ncbi:uncharacterized protein EI90DRAFT_3284841 [Cantharellus anzutake]|uniref:uncharacterized protein n=1 Tax=Cantharellus anzutake TaxID=1750568 RepID=UPI001902E65D|nr:uncharacterized protein EI90DRAFT_3284841 [Cantharellus anzutake]KAF8342701.1 hypothetical protein EI90DRAFT_3284841 [Cantharellus anzutake]
MRDEFEDDYDTDTFSHAVSLYNLVAFPADSFVSLFPICIPAVRISLTITRKGGGTPYMVEAFSHPALRRNAGKVRRARLILQLDGEHRSEGPKGGCEVRDVPMVDVVAANEHAYCSLSHSAQMLRLASEARVDEGVSGRAAAQGAAKVTVSLRVENQSKARRASAQGKPSLMTVHNGKAMHAMLGANRTYGIGNAQRAAQIETRVATTQRRKEMSWLRDFLDVIGHVSARVFTGRYIAPAKNRSS